MIAGSLHALERFLLPNVCVVCDRGSRAPDPDALLCGACRTRLRRVPRGCDRCQQPMPPVGPCRFCRAWPDVLVHARSAVWLDGAARPIVHHAKYGGLARLGGVMADVAVRTLPAVRDAVLVPVPLGARRHRERGYNQADALATALAERWRVRVAAVLIRSRDTRSQTRLTPADRHANVAGAFRAAAPPRAAGRAPNPTVILVDDVLTTGATLTACASALAAAGWGRVEAVTFARALPDAWYTA